MKFNFLIVFIFNILFISTTPIFAETECAVGEVTYEGGAIACPLCETAADDYPYNSEFGDEVNGHIRNALNDDLDSAKWLINYFSQKETKNYEEAKKWFGRALGIGANAKDIPLIDGYDEPYMVTASLNVNSEVTLEIISSCNQVNEQWQPLCYAQVIYFSINNKESMFNIMNYDYKENNILIQKITYYEFKNENFLIIFETENNKDKNNRYDYFTITKDSNVEYLGSNKKPDNIFIATQSSRSYIKMPEDYYPEADYELAIIKENILNNINEQIKTKAFTYCITFNINSYPAK